MTENYKNNWVGSQWLLTELNNTKGHPGLFLIKSKLKGIKAVFKNTFSVRSIRIFANFLGDPYYEPLLWFMIID